MRSTESRVRTGTGLRVLPAVRKDRGAGGPPRNRWAGRNEPSQAPARAGRNGVRRPEAHVGHERRVPRNVRSGRGG